MNDVLRPSKDQSLDTLSSVDRKVIDAFKTNDPRAFELLISSYGDRLRRVIRGYLRDADTADDILQETYIRIFKSIGNFQENAKLYTWMYRIAVNRCIDYIREKKFREKFSVNRELRDTDLLDENAFTYIGSRAYQIPPDVLYDRTETAIQIQDALLNGLSKTYREIIKLVLIDGLSHQEAAQVLGIPKGTVVSRLHWARKFAKLHLQTHH